MKAKLACTFLHYPVNVSVLLIMNAWNISGQTAGTGQLKHGIQITASTQVPKSSTHTILPSSRMSGSQFKLNLSHASGPACLHGEFLFVALLVRTSRCFLSTASERQ